jgi:hypothetical protein
VPSALSPPGRSPSQRVYVYTLKVDSGFAPNPFHGWCSLACCKPQIRQTAKAGDWVVGITPVAKGHLLAYAMRVDEVLSRAEYWADRRFYPKRPSWEDGRPWDHRNDRENLKLKAVDLGCKRVLVGRHYAYYGSQPKLVPDRLAFMMPGRFYRVRFTDAQKALILDFVDSLPPGIHAPPGRWKSHDGSWRRTASRCG